MTLDRRVIRDVNSLDSIFGNAIMRGDQVQPGPLITIPLDVPAAKNRPNNLRCSRAFGFVLAP